MKLSLLLLLAAVTTAPTSRPGGEIVPPARRDVPGQRIQIPAGELFIPDFFSPDEKGRADVVVWFLGAAWCAEQGFYDSRKNAVLLVTNSATLKAGFEDAETFDELLADVRKNIGDKPIGRVCIASFSGGYTAVRDILRHERLRESITDVVLADSLYAPKATGTTDQLEPSAMQPFLDYARAAADGKCVFLFSHLYPPELQYRGNTTTLAANHLIDALGVKREPASASSSRGAKILYRAERKGFHVLGYAGMTNQDHFDHFYGVADLLRQTSLRDAPAISR